MGLSAFEHPGDRAPGAGQSRTLQPNHQCGPAQPDIKTSHRKIALADPLLTGVSALHQGPESGNVFLSPVWAPDGIQTDDRRARAFAELARESCLPAARAAQDDDSCHALRLSQDFQIKSTVSEIH